MRRLFFALWPDQTTRQRCLQVQQALGGTGKPVAALNLHVTLLFLGHVDAARQIAMRQAAAKIEFQTMNLIFDRLDYWKKPAVVCLRVAATDPAVSNLAARLADAARQTGLPIDERSYQPHVTLLRNARSLTPVTFAPIHWHADGFCLVESCSMPGGVEYRVINQWDLPRSCN